VLNRRALSIFSFDRLKKAASRRGRREKLHHSQDFKGKDKGNLTGIKGIKGITA